MSQPQQWFSKCGLRTSGINATWRLVGSTDALAPPQTCQILSSGVGLAICVLTRLFTRNSDARWSWGPVASAFTAQTVVCIQPHSITWELVRNSDSRAPPQATESESACFFFCGYLWKLELTQN